MQAAAAAAGAPVSWQLLKEREGRGGLAVHVG